MKPEVTVTADEIAVTYPDGMSWTWPRRDPESPVPIGTRPYEHVCAPVTCEEHEHRFNRAWSLMVDVKRADRGLSPWKQDPRAALAGQALEAALAAPSPTRKGRGSRGRTPEPAS